MGIKPITIGEEYRNIIPEPEKANPLPMPPKKKSGFSTPKPVDSKKASSNGPVVKNDDGTIRLEGFAYFCTV